MSSRTASRSQGDLACLYKWARSDLIQLILSSFLGLRRHLSTFWLIVVIMIIKPALFPHFDLFLSVFVGLAARAGGISLNRPLAFFCYIYFLGVVWSIAMSRLREYAPPEILPSRLLLLFRSITIKGKVNYSNSYLLRIVFVVFIRLNLL